MLLIFVPQTGPAAGASRETLRTLGLGELVDAPHVSISDGQPGPNQLRGAMFLVGPLVGVTRLGYDPDSQVWREATAHSDRGLAAGRCWFGVSRVDPPRPADFLRHAPRPGLDVVLHDGQPWRIAAATLLPHTWGLGESGAIERRVEPRYADFARRSQEYARLLGAAEALEQITFAEGWQYACQALAINYHLDETLVDLLGLLDDDSFPELLAATLEIPLRREVESQKKSLA